MIKIILMNKMNKITAIIKMQIKNQKINKINQII